jgi:hypothetical protein
MKPAIAIAVLLAVTAPALAQPTVVCPYGQTCNGAPAVPFPVINPMQGLSNVLTAPQRQNQPPPQQPVYGYTPIPTPPPVMPAARP